jgi:hypothetical protein
VRGATASAIHYDIGHDSIRAASLRHQVTPIVLPMAAAVLASTCGDGRTDDATTTATRPTDALRNGTGENEGTIDVGQSAVSVIYGAGGGDLPSDQPALAAGDFDGDGLYDLAVGARSADTDAGADAGSTTMSEAVISTVNRQRMPSGRSRIFRDFIAWEPSNATCWAVSREGNELGPL